MSKTIDISKNYLMLIKRFPLRPIKNEHMLDEASELYSELVLKSNHRTTEEEDFLSVLGSLIREYEEHHLKPLAKPMTARRALASLMEDNRLTQSELARKIDVPQSIISEFLAGKRALSTTLIVKLARYFKVSSALFLPST